MANKPVPSESNLPAPVSPETASPSAKTKPAPNKGTQVWERKSGMFGRNPVRDN